MGTDAKLKLAIRTVAVTTRVAVKSHEKRGDPELAAASARRGLQLLQGIGQSLDNGASSEARQAFDQARRELSVLASAGGGMRTFSVGSDDGSLEEKVDVRPKLRP